MRYLPIITLIIASTLFGSCGNNFNFKKTKSGLEYHFFKQNEAAKAGNVKDIYSINTTITNAKNERIMQEFLMFERFISVYPGDFHEGLSMLHEGDSVVFKLNADSFYYHHGMQKPKSLIKPNETILMHVGVKSIQTAFQHLLYMNERELSEMNAFVERKKWQVETDSSGIQYELVKENPTGKPVNIGDEVSISYFYYMLNETIISKSKDGDYWKFTVGDPTRIPGLSRVLMLMRNGEKMRAILPFSEAFGNEGMGVQIPPYTTIVIELEVHSIEDGKQ